MDENGLVKCLMVQKVRFAVLGPMCERVSRKQEATDEVISVAPTVIHACSTLGHRDMDLSGHRARSKNSTEARCRYICPIIGRYEPIHQSSGSFRCHP
jgi:hypothetical protein